MMDAPRHPASRDPGAHDRLAQDVGADLQPGVRLAAAAHGAQLVQVDADAGDGIEQPLVVEDGALHDPLEDVPACRVQLEPHDHPGGIAW